MSKNNGPEHESDIGINRGILGGDRFSDIGSHNLWGRVSEIFFRVCAVLNIV